jgi:predicted transcriptional regulator
MNVKQLVEKLNFEVVAGAEGLQNEVIGGYSSDLLSDVMGHAEAGCIWITLQTHKNVMAIASLKELAAVVLVKGFQPEPDMLQQANIEGIPVLVTTKSTFEINGLIFNLLKA